MLRAKNNYTKLATASSVLAKLKIFHPILPHFNSRTSAHYFADYE